MCRALDFRRRRLPTRPHDRVAGESKYSIKKLLAFSLNTIMCFSNLPLKLGIYAGAFAGLLGVAVMIYTLFTRQGAPSRYATIVILNCFMFAILFLIVGIIGEYIAILFSELKTANLYRARNTRMWRKNLCEGKENPPELFRRICLLFQVCIGIFKEG